MIVGKNSVNSSLIQHKWIHTGVIPYNSNNCGICFSLKVTLTNHMLIHIGEKSYKCIACRNQFRCQANFTRHMRIHRGEKPYKCKDCGKPFSTLPGLTDYMWVHIGEKPYKCQECWCTFSVWGNLNKHIHIHTGEKSYLCEECGKQFHLAYWLETLKLTDNLWINPLFYSICKYILEKDKQIHTGESLVCKVWKEVLQKVNKYPNISLRRGIMCLDVDGTCQVLIKYGSLYSSLS